MRHFDVDRRLMKSSCFLAGVFCVPVLSHAADPLPDAVPLLAVTAEQWASPRNGEVIVSMPPLVAVMQDVMSRPASRIALRHPGGEEGIAWAQDLRDWLVALGMSSDRIEVVQGGAGGAIELAVLAAPSHNTGKEGADPSGSAGMASFPVVDIPPMDQGETP
ncbi:MAG: hypothetical protein M3A44_05075 [Gammaproteobacteria bacterium]